MMRNLALLALASIGCHRSHAAELTGCQAAVITYEDHELGADGVERDARYRETFLRCGEHVWTERVVPARAHDDHDDHHHHPDPAVLAHHVIGVPGGAARLELVSRDEKLIIDVAAPDHDSVGFGGRWDAASRLLGAESRASMKRLDRAAPPGAQWLERREKGLYQTVLWSSVHDLPLSIEIGDEKGVRRRRITVTPGPAPASLPWEQLQGFTHKDWADFGD